MTIDYLEFTNTGRKCEIDLKTNGWDQMIALLKSRKRQHYLSTTETPTDMEKWFSILGAYVTINGGKTLTVDVSKETKKTCYLILVNGVVTTLQGQLDCSLTNCKLVTFIGKENWIQIATSIVRCRETNMGVDVKLVKERISNYKIKFDHNDITKSLQPILPTSKNEDTPLIHVSFESFHDGLRKTSHNAYTLSEFLERVTMENWKPLGERRCAISLTIEKDPLQMIKKKSGSLRISVEYVLNKFK